MRSLHMLDCRRLPLAPASAGSDLLEAVVSPEIEALDRATYAAWGTGISLEQYLQRERVMRMSAFSQQGLRTWVLREQEPASPVLASCESYDVKVWVAGRAGLGQGIASVYVDPAQRGQGHASGLLRKVHEALRQEGSRLCFLMSEVGPKIYGNLGYVGDAGPVRVRRYAAKSADAPRPWELLTEADVAAALSARNLPESQPGPDMPLRIEISEAHIAWHLLRGRFYASALGQKPLRHVGARRGDALVLWAPEYRDSILQILTLHPGVQGFAAAHDMLRVARAVAAEQGFRTVEIWENPQNAEYLHDGELTEGKDLPMLLGLSPEVRGEDWLDYERAHWL